MIDENPDAKDELEIPLYATFSARVQAWLTDVAVLAGALALVIIAGGLAREVPGSGRVLVLLCFGIPLLYEPFFVSRYGATIGHRRANLCVVADNTRANPGFWRAFLRFLTKMLLGPPSFVSMAITSRHQAIHDHVTRTTVQLRNPVEARPGDFVLRRDLGATYVMPSLARRVIMSVLYLTVLLIAYTISAELLVPLDCLTSARCSTGEDAILAALNIALAVGSVACIIGGGRGQLPGARRRLRDDADRAHPA